MIRLIMHGCNGKMGQVISKLVATDSELTIVAGIDKNAIQLNEYPVFESLDLCNIKADVVIDFSSPITTETLLKYCIETQTPCVLCTTGLSDNQLQLVEKASQHVAILKSANMSVGINLLIKVLKEVAPTLSAAGFDIEIVEKHHNMKVDAPSGTALALGDAINEECGNKFNYVYDRSNCTTPRTNKEIGFSVIRGGTIVGDHDIIFAGEDEVITFSHMAYSKNLFAKGAVEASKFLASKSYGLYQMSDVMQ